MTKQIGMVFTYGLSVASPVITAFDVVALAIKVAEDHLLILMVATYLLLVLGCACVWHSKWNCMTS